MDAQPGGELILASASARRADLLRSAGVTFEIRPADIDETRREGEAPRAFALRMAEEKARAIADQRAEGDARPVLGADTIVVIDGDALGKPTDRADAAAMIRRLADREHEVISAFCVLCGRGAHVEAVHTRVHFRAIGEGELETYLDRGGWSDKAGAYAIQAEAGVFVRAIEGSYSNVVGLPLCETVEALEAVVRGAP